MIRRLEVSFDHHSAAFAEDPHRRLDELRDQCPVAWSPEHGGYWLVTGFAEATRVLGDPDTFASGKFPNGDSAVVIPSPPTPTPPEGETPMTYVPIETDGATWRSWRNLFNPILSPAAVDRMQPMIERWTTHFLDRVCEQGRAEFVTEVASPVSAAVTTEWLGLPLEYVDQLARISHDSVAAAPGSAAYEAAMVGHEWMYDLVAQTIAERREDPRPDTISYIAHYEGADGRPIPARDALMACVSMIEAGIDTTTAFVSQVVLYLGTHPDVRRHLRADLTQLPLATEEFLRYLTPVSGLGRRVVSDVDLGGGATLHAGDRVLVCYPAANRDPREFDRPDEVVLDRLPNRHKAFGLGIHRCVGSNLARAVSQTVLSETLLRLGDYSVDEAGVRRYPNAGTIVGLTALPIEFQPGQRSALAPGATLAEVER